MTDSERTLADVPEDSRDKEDPQLAEEDVEGHCRWRTVDLQIGEDDTEPPLRKG